MPFPFLKYTEIMTLKKVLITLGVLIYLGVFKIYKAEPVFLYPTFYRQLDSVAIMEVG